MGREKFTTNLPRKSFFSRMGKSVSSFFQLLTVYTLPLLGLGDGSPALTYSV
jgi:hypothetical protein